MFANGAQALSSVFFWIYWEKRYMLVWYTTVALNWLALLVLTLTLIHVADLQIKF